MSVHCLRREPQPQSHGDVLLKLHVCVDVNQTKACEVSPRYLKHQDIMSDAIQTTKKIVLTAQIIAHRVFIFEANGF